MLSCVPDPWLSETTGVACYKVAGAGDAPAIAATLEGRGDGFFFTRIPVTAIALVKEYTDGGFSLVDTNVTLEATGAQLVQCGGLDVEVRRAIPADYAALQAIAASAFAYSRFHLDPLFPDGLANRIKREWIRSYCQATRGDALLAALVEGRVCGFLAALKTEVGGKSAAVIDLVAVDETVRGRGLARALVGQFQEQYRSQAEVLRVGTQMANTGSLGLYQACGFTIVDAAYVLHAHRRNGVFL